MANTLLKKKRLQEYQYLIFMVIHQEAIDFGFTIKMMLCKISNGIFILLIYAEIIV
jgi:hypothetical protein